MIKRQKKDMSEFAGINDITVEQWIEHYTQLYREKEEEDDGERNNEGN